MHIQAPHTAPAIPIARGGPLTTDMLNDLLPAARAAAVDPETLTTEMAVLMRSSYAAICEELIHRRRLMEVIQDCCETDNVVFLAPGDR